jgi:LacI family transcriptional regulator
MSEKAAPPPGEQANGFVTIKDVARLAGVSPSTASRVFTRSHRVSEAFAARVRGAASQLGYMPNAAARALRRAKSMTLGIVHNHLESPVQFDILRGLGVACQEAGFALLVTTANRDRQLYRALVRRLFEARVDGLFLASPLGVGDSLAPYSRARIPVLALFARDESAAHLPLVTADEGPAVQEAVRRLLDLGHTAIGQLLTRVEIDFSSRFSAVAETLRASGRGDVSHVLEVVEGTNVEASLRRAARRLLDRPERPTAVILTQAFVSGLMEVLAERHLSVPDDVSIISFSDSPWAQMMNPPIATVCVDSEEIGRLAATVMISWLAGETPPTVTYASPPRWIERASVGPAPAATRPRQVAANGS